MKPCPHKHVEARIWSRHFQDWIALGPDHRTQPDALICRDCGEWLGLGEAKEDSEAVREAILLGGLISKHACDFDGEAFDEACEIVVDIFATDYEPNPNLRKPGPRSPIETMVDRACGLTEPQ